MKLQIKLLIILFLISIFEEVRAQTYSYDVPYWDSLYDNSSFPRTNPITLKPFGVVKGIAGTNPNGASTYTIPIECPPSTNGMIANISLVYNSQGGNGIAGQGWNIAGGLSVISRGGNDFFHDGKVTPVSYNNNDVFFLDGTRLYPVIGSNGANGTTYRTESESFAVIKSYNYAGDGSSPEKFRVVNKDGLIMEYGYTLDSRVLSNEFSKVMMWRLNRIEDINGNYIDFVYDFTGRDSRISEIRYTGNKNTGLNPYNIITFKYAGRFDKNTIYDCGYSLESKFVLFEIEVKSEGEVFKKYQLHYGKDAITSFMTEFIEFTPDETVLNETRFKYGDVTSSNVTERTSSDADISSTPNDVFSADFNGDGYSDLLVATKAVDASLKLPYNTGYKLKIFNPAAGSYITTESISLSGGFANVNKIDFLKNVYTMLPSDFNGDGLEDVVVTNTHNVIIGSDLKRVLDNIKVSYVNSSGYFASTETIPTPTGYNIINPRYNYFYTGDFNGDGRTDFITILSNYTAYNIFFSSPSLGIYNQMIDVPISSHPTYKENNIFFNADQVAIINMDGDAKSDIMVVEDGTTRIFNLNFSGTYISMDLMSSLGYPTTWHDIQFGDFNGDGKTDILTCPNPPSFPNIHWEVGYSDGKTFKSETKINSDHYIKQVFYYGIHATDNIVVGDFNGDGKSDIYNYYNNGPTQQHRVYYSSGKSFELKNQPTTRYWGKLCLGDYNGDGKTDILNYHGATSAQFQYFKPNDKSLLLHKVNDGFNRTTEYNYEPLTRGTGIGAGDFYTKGSGEIYPVNNGQYPIYVTTSFTNPDGIGGVNTTYFKYKNLRTHKAGRGLLGFENVKFINEGTGIVTENISDLNREFYTTYIKTSKTFFYSTGVQLNQSDNNVSFDRIGTSYCFVQKNNSAVSQNLLKGVTTITTNTYDVYGNVTYNSSTTTGGGLTMTSSSSNTFIATGGSPIPNRPSEIITTTKRGSKPTITVKSISTYYPNGLTKEVSSFPSASSVNFVKKYYEYDLFGNVILSRKNTFVAFSPHTPTTKYEYDSKGRFVISEQNEIGDKKFITTHKFWGKPLSVKDYNGLTSTYTYDKWGKLTSTTIPTSLSTSYTVNYSDGWDLGTNQLYYTYTQDPSSPDVKTWYDYLGRPVKTKQETFGGAWVESKTTYDAKGNVASSTNNYLPTETPSVTNNTYDAFNRLSSSSHVFGTTSYAYTLGSGIESTTVTLPDGKVKKSVLDASGKLIKSSNGIAGTVHYDYDSWGNEIATSIGTTTMGYHTLIQKEYDVKGMLKKMIDQDAGTTSYEYNTYGQLLKQVDPKGKATNYQYDALGRVFQKELDGYITNYNYYGNIKDYALQKHTVTSPTGEVVEDFYDYAIGGGVTKHVKTTNGVAIEKRFTYDTYNNPLTTEYLNSNFKTKNYYDPKGFLQKITTNFNPSLPTLEKTLYEATAMNGNGQVTNFKRVDGLNANIHYYNGVATGFYTPGIQDLSMTYNYANGNVLSRFDNIKQTKEDFEYDAIDRLTKAEAQKLGAFGMMHTPLTMTYDGGFWGSFGQIATKSDVGTYAYGGFPRNAVKSVTDPAAIISHETQDIIYTPFDKAQKITEKIAANFYEEKFVYDGNEDRAYSQQSQGPITPSSIVRKRWYMGDFEIDQKFKGSPKTHQLHYISSDVGLVGIVVEESGNYNYYAVYTDHLGSIVTLADYAGVVVAKKSYDPWGRERNPDTWGYAPTLTAGGTTPTPPEWLYRGYTGHEMLPEYGLINMNARFYDPLNGRMLRPDNFISDPSNSQAYNRFSYAYNNPLTFTDPDGNVPVAAVLIGVAFGMYTGGSMANGGQLNPAKWDFNSGRTWSYMVAGGLVGGVSGGIGAQIAQGGGFMANTMGIVFTSYSNSLGTALYTGGRSGMSVSFGIASYNFTNGDVGYLGEKGNKWYQDLGYAMGGLANLQDAVAGFNGTTNETRAEHGDGILHARGKGKYFDAKGVEKNYDISVAHPPMPEGTYKYLLSPSDPGYSGFLENLDYARYWGFHDYKGTYFPSSASGWKATINNVNSKHMGKMYENITKGLSLGGKSPLRYGFTWGGCYGQVGRALLRAGIPTVPFYGFTPHGLVMQLWLRQAGIYASPFLSR